MSFKTVLSTLFLGLILVSCNKDNDELLYQRYKKIPFIIMKGILILYFFD